MRLAGAGLAPATLAASGLAASGLAHARIFDEANAFPIIVSIILKC